MARYPANSVSDANLIITSNMHISLYTDLNLYLFIAEIIAHSSFNFFYLRPKFPLPWQKFRVQEISTGERADHPADEDLENRELSQLEIENLFNISKAKQKLEKAKTQEDPLAAQLHKDFHGKLLLDYDYEGDTCRVVDIR